MKTEFCVALDGDGHFMISKTSDRGKTIHVLKQIHDGDYWANEAYNYLDEAGISNENDLLSIDENKWKAFIRSFQQRSTVEFITYE